MEDYKKKYDDELKDWVKTTDSLKIEINKLQKELITKNNEISNVTPEQNEIVQNLKNQIEKQEKDINRENEDKISLQEEVGLYFENFAKITPWIPCVSFSLKIITKLNFIRINYVSLYLSFHLEKLVSPKIKIHVFIF